MDIFSPHIKTTTSDHSKELSPQKMGTSELRALNANIQALKNWAGEQNHFEAKVSQQIPINQDNIDKLLTKLDKNSSIYQLVFQLKKQFELESKLNQQLNTSRLTPGPAHTNTTTHANLVKLWVDKLQSANWAVVTHKVNIGDTLRIIRDGMEVKAQSTPIQPQTTLDSLKRGDSQAHKSALEMPSNAFSKTNSTLVSLFQKQTLPQVDHKLRVLQHLFNTATGRQNQTHFLDRQKTNIDNQIASWKNSLPQIAKLSSGAVKHTIQNSGVFFEKRIADILTNKTTISAEQKVSLQQSRELDAKALLTSLLSEITLLNAQPKTSLINKLPSGIEQLLLKLFTPLGKTSATSSESALDGLAAKQEQHGKWLAALEKLVQGSLAKITHSQLNNLSSALSEHASHYIFHDLFFRNDEAFIPVRFWLKKEKENKEKKKISTREWHVFFEWHASMPEETTHDENNNTYLQNSASIKLSEEKLNINIWIAHPEHRLKAKHQAQSLIQQLKDESITVEGVKFAERPIKTPNPPIQASHLVDIRT